MSSLLGNLVTLEAVYVLTGCLLLVFSVLTFRDTLHPNRLGSGCFWLVLGLIFVLGGVLPYWLTGLLVLVLVAIDGAGRVTRSAKVGSPTAPVQEPRRIGDRIFLPVLVIPVVTFMTAGVFRLLAMDVSRGALVGLGLGSVAAMIVGLALTGGTVVTMLEAGRRLNESMGAVNILPQLLASLGVVFTAAKVGDLIATGIQGIVPEGSLFLLVLANCFGMALFTIVMGNSFAALPVIATGVLVPLIIKPFGVDPAMAAIITLTAGSSGTLMTPMAANFNIVPAALLEMRNQYGVIKFQLPFALTIWSLHVVLMWVFIKFF
ncbi:MAG: DUF979 family protein [Acidobacteriota bacterium]